MNKIGFEFMDRNGQKELRLIMPEELKSSFFASIYCRGELMDSTDGDPEKIWGSMSSNFNNIGLVAPYQVHGTKVIYSSSSFALPLRPEADGVLIDRSSDSLASLRFADCCPVVLASDSSEPWMLLLHSGFVGTVENIVGKSLARLSEQMPGSKRERIRAWIGPCICKDCYSRKIEDPSTQNALKVFSPDNYRNKNGMVYFDIRGEIKRQLMQCSVPYDNIYEVEGCTCCNNDFYYSYRAGDKRGRIFLLGGNTTKLA